MIPRLVMGERELLAVPAIHNLGVFAEQVNRACRDDVTRPQAVAVELSHDTVMAVMTWLKELGVGSGCAGRIPCMLGLVKANRRIHPRHRESAMRLQEQHGLPLHQIAPEILKKEINFSPVSLLCLSTTDSMIEAIRSAIELDLPVYGIDLGDTAAGERGRPMVQDPVLAQHGLASYVERNERTCDPHRDEVVDGRREWAMAARLKRLLLQYDRVLFTGGLGHWQQLRRRLAEPTLAPAVEPVSSEGETLARVVVAPSVAVHQMDLFPDLTVDYESIRELPLQAAERYMDFAAIYRDKLAAAWECAEPANREAAAAFSHYLANFSLLCQRQVPDLFMTLHAARAMVSAAFASRLGEVLILQALEWARPEQWPGLPYLEETQGGSDPFPATGAERLASLRRGDERSSPFHLNHISESQIRDPDCRQLPLLPEPGRERSRGKRRIQCRGTWLWPPCETVLYGSAYAAAEMADRNRREHSPEPFAGSLHDGVDAKATLRSIISGQRRVQVKVRSASSTPSPSTEFNDEPAVFIFEAPETVRNGSWGTFIAATAGDIRKSVRDKTRFDAVIRERGDDFVVTVHHYAEREVSAALKPYVSSQRYLYGTVIFGRPSLTPLQAARWIEESDYAACPILNSCTASDVFSYYHREHGMRLDSAQWPTTLVRLALPYAKRRVMVMTPPRLVLPPEVFREARARAISLQLLPLAHFPPERVEAMRRQHLVHPRNLETMDYSGEMQAALGESPEHYLDLLPERILAQLDPETR